MEQVKFDYVHDVLNEEIVSDYLQTKRIKIKHTILMNYVMMTMMNLNEMILVLVFVDLMLHLNAMNDLDYDDDHLK